MVHMYLPVLRAWKTAVRQALGSYGMVFLPTMLLTARQTRQEAEVCDLCAHFNLTFKSVSMNVNNLSRTTKKGREGEREGGAATTCLR